MYDAVVKEPKRIGIFKKAIATMLGIKQHICQLGRLIVLGQAKRLQPESDGRNHILTNTQFNHSIPIIEGVSFFEEIITFLQPK